MVIFRLIISSVPLIAGTVCLIAANANDGKERSLRWLLAGASLACYALWIALAVGAAP